MEKYTLTISIADERGSVSAEYEGVRRDDLLKEAKMAALLRLHDHSIPDEGKSENAEIKPELCGSCGGTCEVACSSTNYMPCPACQRGKE